MWQNWSDCTTVGILLGLVVLAVVLVVLPIIWPFQWQVGDNGEDDRPS